MSPALAAMVAAALSGPPLPAPVDLSSAQLAGQRVAFAYEGIRPPGALVRRIEQGRAAGVILFRRNIRSSAQLRQTMGGLQRAARRSALKLPLLVMVDQEGGRVTRLPGGPGRSAAGVRGARDALADGRTAGRALRAGGVNVDLAPVADVCRRRGALERERRCYGTSPSAVTSRAGAFARGLSQRGVAPALKHFPGFGAARVNTDFAPATIRASRRRLRTFDGRPFAALHRRASLVMLSTAVYPALSRRPAALSSAIATDELRGRLGFRGVSVADALDTPALARHGGTASVAVKAAGAGTDLMLFARSFAAGDRAARALERSLRSGRLRRGAFERAAGRVLALRDRLR